MPYKNKDIQKIKQHESYIKNKPVIVARTKEKRNKFVKYSQNLKEKTPCADCGVNFPHFIMDFDHVRGTKKFNISASSIIPSMEALLSEIEKCDIVCANCHRFRTYNRLLK